MKTLKKSILLGLILIPLLLCISCNASSGGGSDNTPEMAAEYFALQSEIIELIESDSSVGLTVNASLLTWTETLIEATVSATFINVSTTLNSESITINGALEYDYQAVFNEDSSVTATSDYLGNFTISGTSYVLTADFDFTYILYYATEYAEEPYGMDASGTVIINGDSYDINDLLEIYEDYLDSADSSEAVIRPLKNIWKN